MPELPEVETVVRSLRPHVVGKKIIRVAHLRADMVTPAGSGFSRAVTGRIIRSLTRRGKRIVFQLDDGRRFFIHLGMSGRLIVVAREAQLAPHTHLILDIGRGRQLRFVDPRRFGEIRWLGCGPCDDNMGPEPLTMRATELAKRLSKTRRSIKNALMDQRLVAGLGNIYVDESLFDARVHPESRADRLRLEQIHRLSHSIKRVLKRAITHRGSSMRDYVDARGKRGRFQNLHRVYQREGKSCPACEAPIARILIGGRSTHFCPTCQQMNHREKK